MSSVIQMKVKNEKRNTNFDINDSEDKQTPKVIKLFDKKEASEKPKTPPQKSEPRSKSDVSSPKAKKSKIQATILPGMLDNEFKVSV